jgi:hypothetical protein
MPCSASTAATIRHRPEGRPRELVRGQPKARPPRWRRARRHGARRRFPVLARTRAPAPPRRAGGSSRRAAAPLPEAPAAPVAAPAETNVPAQPVERPAPPWPHPRGTRRPQAEAQRVALAAQAEAERLAFEAKKAQAEANLRLQLDTREPLHKLNDTVELRRKNGVLHKGTLQRFSGAGTNRMAIVITLRARSKCRSPLSTPPPGAAWMPTSARPSSSTCSAPNYLPHQNLHLRNRLRPIPLCSPPAPAHRSSAPVHENLPIISVSACTGQPLG